MMLVLFTAGVFACDGNGTIAEVQGLLDDAVAHFAEEEWDAFGADVVRARALLPCVQEPVDSELAAAWHLVDALDRSMQDDAAGRQRAFQAYANASGRSPLPATIAPEPGYGLAALYERAADEAEGSRAALRVPYGAQAQVDGLPASDLPTDLPSVVQVWNRAGAICWTSAIEPGALMPHIECPAPHWRAPLAITSAATLSIAGGMLAWNLNANHRFDEGPLSGVTAAATETRISAAIGWPALAAAVVTGAVLVVTW